MPYAADGQISQEPLPGGIEISSQQYAQALEGMLAGDQVRIVNAKMVVAAPEPDPQPEPMPDVEPDWQSRIAGSRYAAEVAGTSFSGMNVDTGRDSQGLITGAALAAMLDPSYRVRWKTDAGFVELDAQQIIAVASAVRAHVQGCFDREADLLEALEAGTFTEAMLDEGWPE